MTIGVRETEKLTAFMNTLPGVCQSRRLAMPKIRFVVTGRNGRTWAFAVFAADEMPGKLESYRSDEFLHQLSTALNGMPVTYSNSTGFRLAALLEGPAALRDMVVYPDRSMMPGRLTFGVDAAGREISTTWRETPHLAVAGMTQSGKSSFLRLIAATCIMNGDKLLVADPPGTTLRMLNGHPSLLAPVAQTPEEIQNLLMTAARLADERSKLYAGLEAKGNFPENIDEYNELAPANGRLDRVVLILDELTAMCDQTGGKASPIAKGVSASAWQMRKFGIHLVAAGQSFNVEYVGPVKNEMTGICFSVKTSHISRSTVGHSGAEVIRTPGRALTERWGMIQTYYFDKQRLIDMAQTGGVLSESDRALAIRCLKENHGKLSRSWLADVGQGDREARRIREAWAECGWISKDPGRDNAQCLTPALLNLLGSGWAG